MGALKALIILEVVEEDVACEVASEVVGTNGGKTEAETQTPTRVLEVVEVKDTERS